MTVKQVSTLTGVSVRTLQYYDEIGLLKPAQTTEAGYRLYDDAALERLQQVLFFKELDFSLKEISAILADPGFDRAAALAKQRELLGLKRDRLDRLLGLLDRLIKGENCMEFQAFDMSGYFQMLDDFKRAHTDLIVAQLGSVEQYDAMVSGMKQSEQTIAESAVRIYGSVEAYTQAMKKNMEQHYASGPAIAPEDVGALTARTEELTRRVTADLSQDPASPQVRRAVGELIDFIVSCNHGMDMGENYWSCIAESYLSKPVLIEITEQKYGPGSARFLGLAIQAYLDAESGPQGTEMPFS